MQVVQTFAYNILQFLFSLHHNIMWYNYCQCIKFLILFVRLMRTLWRWSLVSPEPGCGPEIHRQADMVLESSLRGVSSQRKSWGTWVAMCCYHGNADKPTEDNMILSISEILQWSNIDFTGAYLLFSVFVDAKHWHYKMMDHKLQIICQLSSQPGETFQCASLAFRQNWYWLSTDLGSDPFSPLFF